MNTNEKNAIGIIFANMHDATISNLTKVRTMASVPFGGRYRLIDFPLSNFVNANIYNIGVITKANYQSLMDHVGNGREWDLARKRGGLHILPPYGNKNYGVYRGKIEALGAALDFLRNSSAKQVILSDCELVLNVDLVPLLNAHKDSGADITIMYTKAYMSTEDAQDATIVTFDENERLTEVMCNPYVSGEFNYFMNIAVVNREFLMKLVVDCISRGEYSFDRDILQKKRKILDIRGFYCNDLIRKITSINSFYQANISLLKDETRKKLFCSERPIYTKVRDEAPARYGVDGTAKNSFVADGCVINGQVENSVIFRGCKIEKGAVVKNSILMQDTQVNANAQIQYVITDKKVCISENSMIFATETAPTYIGKGIHV